jgi:hypothetical protein
MAVTFEQLVRQISLTTSLWNPQFTIQEMSEGMHDALKRIEALEAQVKALTPHPPPANPGVIALHGPKV